MKIFPIILAICFTLNVTAQQAWDLFPLQQRSYVQIGEELLLHYNDSTEYLRAQKRLHHFGQQYYDLPFDSC